MVYLLGNDGCVEAQHRIVAHHLVAVVIAMSRQLAVVEQLRYKLADFATHTKAAVEHIAVVGAHQIMKCRLFQLGAHLLRLNDGRQLLVVA